MHQKLTPTEALNFQQALVAWYDSHHRPLPWRALRHDPYAVWVSEIMCQQTQVRTVIPYFLRWMERFPTVQSLASADLEEVLAHWSGLGYYSRARSLHSAAKLVVAEHGDRVPCDPKSLRALPGIGAYTCGAILSVAFDQPAPLVDANVARVLSRVFCIEGDTRTGRAYSELWEAAAALIPSTRPGDHNQGLMELGALVCRPAMPECHRCPVSPWCEAGKSDNPTRCPSAQASKKTERVRHVSLAVMDGSDVWMTRRPENGVWGGLWELPRVELEPGEPPEEGAVRAAIDVLGIEPGELTPVGTVTHQVMHFAITLFGFLALVRVEMEPTDMLRKWPIFGELPAVSSPQKRMLELVAKKSPLQSGTHPSARNVSLFDEPAALTGAETNG